MRVEVAPEARRDIAALLRTSERNFGKAARSRYRQLLQAAFEDLRNDPGRPGLSRPPALPQGLCLLHLRHVRTVSEVANPRHYVAFRVVGETVQILRVVHDAMNLSEHLKVY